MFADSLLDTPWTDRSRCRWTTLVSFAMQAVAVAGASAPAALHARSATIAIVGRADRTGSATGASRAGIRAKHS